MTTLQQMASGQASPEVVFNEVADTLSAVGIFGKKHTTSSGLTWGYYGGFYNSTSVADGTVSLTNSTTNYVVSHRTTGVVSTSTSTTNWNDTATYARLYKLTTAGGVVTATEDHRLGNQGLIATDPSGGGSFQPLDSDLTTIAGLTATSDNFLQAKSSAWASRTPTQVAADLSSLIKATESIIIACSDETTALAAGTGKVTFRMPYAFTLSAVRASLTTAQTSGSIFTVDINEAGSSVLSTKLTIDNTEKTSTTAATAAVISDASLADDAEMTVDIDQIGDGTAKGLKVVLIGSRT